MHPNIDVNKVATSGATPLYLACQQGHKEVVSMLVGDLRTDVNKPKFDKCTPLWVAAQNGFLPVVLALLASDREVDTKMKSVAETAAWNNRTAAMVAKAQVTRARYPEESEEEFERKKKSSHVLATIIGEYQLNRQEVRGTLRQMRDFGKSFFFSFLSPFSPSHFFVFFLPSSFFFSPS